MGFFKNLFGSKEKSEEQKENKASNITGVNTAKNQGDVYTMHGLTSEVTPEEKELVSVITSAIMVGENPNSKVKVHNVLSIDTDGEVAFITAAAIASADSPNSKYRLSKITKLNQ